MRTNKTRIATLAAAGAGAAAIAIAGFAMPASADDSYEETTTHTQVAGSFDTLGEAFQTWVGDITAGNIGVDGGLVNGPLVSDVANGPILSGNDVPVGSGNDVSAPVGSGNDVAVDAPVGSGNEVGNGNAVGSGNDTGVSLGDIGADVDDLVGGISSDVDSTLNGVLGGGLLD
ncbi:MAG: hypothetical protein ABW024_03325 [Microbacterium sp.]